MCSNEINYCPKAGHQAWFGEGPCAACVIEDEIAKGAIRLLPCPFCGGPPVPIVTRAIGGGVFPISEAENSEDGVYAQATIFCHECGADCGHVDTNVFSQADADEMIVAAIERWQNRGLKNLYLYTAGEAEKLNFYPRPDRVTEGPE